MRYGTADGGLITNHSNHRIISLAMAGPELDHGRRPHLALRPHSLQQTKLDQHFSLKDPTSALDTSLPGHTRGSPRFRRYTAYALADIEADDDYPSKADAVAVISVLRWKLLSSRFYLEKTFKCRDGQNCHGQDSSFPRVVWWPVSMLHVPLFFIASVLNPSAIS